MERMLSVICFLLPWVWTVTPAMNSSGSHRPTCVQGWTGSDSGGSCSFNHDSLCDWEDLKDDLHWELTGNDAVLDPAGPRGVKRGRLLSATLCGQPEDALCLEIRLGFGWQGGSKMMIKVCDSDHCRQVFQIVADDSNWHLYAIFFTAPRPFQILVVGEKYEDYRLGESNMFIDYIKYNHSTCGQKGTTVMAGTGRIPDQETSSDSSVTGTLTTNTLIPSSTPDHSLTPGWTEEVATADRDLTSRTSWPESDGVTKMVEERNETPGGKSQIADDDDDDDDDDGGGVLVLVACVCGGLVLMLVLVVATVLLVRRRRKRHMKESREASARYERNDSVLMVSNDLYGYTGQVPADSPHEIAREQERQSTPVTVTSQQVSSDTDDAYYTSVKRPQSSPASATSRDSGVAMPLINGARESATTAVESTEDQVYENTGPLPDNNDTYENIGINSPLVHNQSDRDTSTTRPTARPRQTTLAGETGARETASEAYKKVDTETTVYNHLNERHSPAPHVHNAYDHLAD